MKMLLISNCSVCLFKSHTGGLWAEGSKPCCNHHKSEGERLLYDTFKYDALNRIGLIKALKGKVATA